MPREKPGAVGGGGEGESSRTCLRELGETGVVAGRAAGFVGSGQCIVEDPVAVEAVDTRAGKITLPARPILACRFVAILAAWLREVVSPVADSLLGSPVDAVVTGPGHQCRQRPGGRLSEHAIGNAVDISQFRLVDGRSILVARLAGAEGAERVFLRAISASACGYFTTVLGPGSDPDHSGHLHIDLAERRLAEFRICMIR